MPVNSNAGQSKLSDGSPLFLVNHQDAVDVDPGDRRRQPARLPFPCDRRIIGNEGDFLRFCRDLHFHLDRAESGNEIREIIAVGEGQVAPVEQVEARPSVFRLPEGDIDGRRAVHKDRRLRKQVFDHSADELPNMMNMRNKQNNSQDFSKTRVVKTLIVRSGYFFSCKFSISFRGLTIFPSLYFLLSFSTSIISPIFNASFQNISGVISGFTWQAKAYNPAI